MKYRLLILAVITSLSYEIKQSPLTDNQYRQANVPPVVAVIMDVPAYGKKELFKWDKFIQANSMKVFENRKKNEELELKMYKDRLKRMGAIKAKIG